jgi:hypothetical protein
MRRRSMHIILLLLVVVLPSCHQQHVDWNVTMNKDGKNPYDTYLAHNSLKHFFPAASIKDLSRTYRFSSMDGNTMYNNTGTTMMVLTGLTFGISQQEWDKLKMFVRAGNELVIFGSAFDPKIEEAFNIRKQGAFEQQPEPDDKYFTSNRDVLTLANDSVHRFGYTGRAITAYFTSRGKNRMLDEVEQHMAADTVVNEGDTASVIREAAPPVDSIVEENYSGDEEEDNAYLIADTMGYVNGRPNCLRIPMGRGHITLHAAPLVTSNYFLLQGRNIDYLAGLWSLMPADVDRIYWDDYYIHSPQESSSNALWKYPATRYGLLLAILIALTYVLFQMKRRQRIVPVIPPLRNDSVSFVETVGRLYYNKGNNANLAEKMAQQFLEWARMNCYLSTNRLNEEFILQLTLKTGQPQAKTEALVQMIHEVRLGGVHIDDAYLYQFYNTIQDFYKNHHTQWKA